jgi:hypothetical protein
MSLSPSRGRVVALLLIAACGSSCGASTYVVSPSTSYPGGPIAALRGDSNQRVLVRSENLVFARAVPVDPLRVRVRPRRPYGLVVSGAVSLGIGLAMVAGEVGHLFTPSPPGVRNEDWLTSSMLLSMGSGQALVGIILLSVGGARWSPEVAR